MKICAAALEAMLQQARAQWPRECCGLLGGAADVITEILPAANALDSAREFFIDPQELIASLRALRERGLKHLGIYHSHPETVNVPSRRDVEMAYYPSCAYFIVSPQDFCRRSIRAFEIRNGQVTELEFEAVP